MSKSRTASRPRIAGHSRRAFSGSPHPSPTTPAETTPADVRAWKPQLRPVIEQALGGVIAVAFVYVAAVGAGVVRSPGGAPISRFLGAWVFVAGWARIVPALRSWLGRRLRRPAAAPSEAPRDVEKIEHRAAVVGIPPAAAGIGLYTWATLQLDTPSELTPLITVALVLVTAHALWPKLFETVFTRERHAQGGE